MNEPVDFETYDKMCKQYIQAKIERDKYKEAWETSTYNMNLVEEIARLKAEIKKLQG